ncbi:hypothetical protein VF14_25440 [Nostoc linckia z18]|uniref:Uncharacterized protein n=2 Tax=Nostoc linckia TaxID=92942 RepID=A0A9Q6EJG1_NOSLI|nr:hypothetical protein [Nostoc linckia]PHK27884.1 hypothetical protein VF12_33955 [Nostoc linckia z15]PHK44326.1 hypothetical protein VF13_22620 [Nostoc linckia z16]PHJ56426.1 hypothetical protein VF03_37580 [Nostoc linckia z2]PHJ58658.1 hypothetical protein VF05_33480 [Nostoc linckia z3]PHJ62806.1 hypothetical protein VF02_16800 [Nostoc linckia z1]
MNRTKPQQGSKVVPFTGELYQAPSPTDQQSNTPALLVILACAAAAGLSIGAMLTYQSTSQTELRQLKADQQQLQQVKEKACN